MGQQPVQNVSGVAFLIALSPKNLSYHGILTLLNASVGPSQQPKDIGAADDSRTDRPTLAQLPVN
jgi:hypothetical protein